MAFNPFSAFRKHQKVLFAVLTIVCMIVFILQFGSGDIFSRFGMGRNTQGLGEKVVTLYGKDVYAGDIQKVGQSRQYANEFLVWALNFSFKGADDEVAAYKPDKPDEIDDRLASLRGSYTSRPQLLQFLPPEQVVQSIRRDIAQVNDLLAGLTASDLPDKSKAADQTKIANDLRMLLKHQYLQLASLTTQAPPLYFGGGVKPEDLLDFMIWKHEADRLGVVLTKADARRATADETAGRDLPADPGASWAADPVFKDFFSRHGAPPEDQVVSAVEDEFRVQIAQRLLSGRAQGIPALNDNEPLPTNPVSPYDFWKYYRDNRTTIKAAFLTIPVESLAADVTEIPSQQELRDLFEQYKGQVPEPTKPTPGFKEPRRIKVEFISASGDAPYYQERIKATTMQAPLFYVGAGLNGLAGGGVVPQTALYGFLNHDPLLADADADFVDNNRTSVAAAGALFASATAPAPAFAAPALAQTAAEQQEQKARLRLASAAFLTAMDGAAGGTAFAGIGLPAASVPPQLTPEQTIQKLVEKRRKDVTPRIVQRDVADFCDELDKLKGNADKAKEEIAKAVKERGWVLHDNAGLDDQYEMDKDEALKPLREALAPFLFDPRNPQKNGSLSSIFFGNESRFPTGLYAAVGPFRGDNDETLAFWRSQDQRAHELTYEEAQPRVLAAWRLQEARKRALALAQRLTAAAHSQASPVEAVKFLRDQGLGGVFELPEPGKPGVARLVPGPSANPGISATYTRYTIPADKIPDAPPGLVDRLLGMEKPGDALFFKDLPQTHFYVAVLEERTNLEFRDRDKDQGFIDAYRDAAQPEKDHLYRQFFLPDREKRLQEQLMRELRAEAGQVNDQGQLVLSNVRQQQPQPGQPAAPEGDEGPPDFGS